MNANCHIFFPLFLVILFNLIYTVSKFLLLEHPCRALSKADNFILGSIKDLTFLPWRTHYLRVQCVHKCTTLSTRIFCKLLYQCENVEFIISSSSLWPARRHDLFSKFTPIHIHVKMCLDEKYFLVARVIQNYSCKLLFSDRFEGYSK